MELFIKLENLRNVQLEFKHSSYKLSKPNLNLIACYYLATLARIQSRLNKYKYEHLLTCVVLCIKYPENDCIQGSVVFYPVSGNICIW